MGQGYYLQFSGRTEIPALYQQIDIINNGGLGSTDVRLIWFDDSQLYWDDSMQRYRFKEHRTTIDKAKEYIDGLIQSVDRANQVSFE